MELSHEAAESLSRHFAAIYHYCHPIYTFSLSHQAVRTLQFIHYQPEATVSDLAAHLGCAHNTASEIVQRLAEKGLLHKERRDDDERALVLSLTEQGTQALYEQTGLDVQHLFTCLNQLSSEEQERILSGVMLLAEQLAREGACEQPEKKETKRMGIREI